MAEPAGDAPAGITAGAGSFEPLPSGAEFLKEMALATATSGIAEEAPAAYKDVAAPTEATELAGLARRATALRPLVCIKG